MNRVRLVERNDFEIGEKRLKNLSGTFPPMVFCRAELKLSNRDGGNENLFLLG